MFMGPIMLGGPIMFNDVMFVSVDLMFMTVRSWVWTVSVTPHTMPT